MRLPVAACAAAFVTLTACGQAPPAESAGVGPYQEHDALTYHITLDVDLEKKRLDAGQWEAFEILATWTPKTPVLEAST